AAGVSARLAVGYQGDRGQVLPWLHAWMEYRDERGRWQIADATEAEADQPLAVGSAVVRSRRAGPSGAPAPGPPVAPDEAPDDLPPAATAEEPAAGSPIEVS